MTESRIKKPFFELGPKLYLTGEKALHLACAADELSEKYGVDIIFTAQYTDLRLIRKNIRHLHLFAQHMDPVIPGRGVGLVLPEALKDAGAEGVLLNHAERPLTLSDLNSCIQRGREVGLITLSIFEVISASTVEYSKARVVFKSLQFFITRLSI